MSGQSTPAIHDESKSSSHPATPNAGSTRSAQLSCWGTVSFCTFLIFVIGGLSAHLALRYIQNPPLSNPIQPRKNPSLSSSTGSTIQYPPPNFDEWFEFAKDNECLIDEYDQILKDFEPFHWLADEDPTHFKKMVDLGTSLTLKESRGLLMIEISNGTVIMPKRLETNDEKELRTVLKRFAYLLPDMNFLINMRGLPRVVFNWSDEVLRRNSRNLEDQQPFDKPPVPMANILSDRRGCGFVDSNDTFIRSSSSSDFTTDLWPILSMTKISPCFSDILIPSVQHHYKTPMSSIKPEYLSNVSWVDKKKQLYWRGVSDGGRIIVDNYRQFTRFRLVDIARDHTSIINAKIDTFNEAACAADCDRDAIIQEYDIGGVLDPPEHIYQHKYVLDLDGNTSSERYLELLRSGSLVFKATTFHEYFSDWLQPYTHYIPVKTDLSDLVSKIQWAIENDFEAQVIQQRGLQTAQRVLTDAQHDCYFALVLLEWARLQNYAKTKLRELGPTR
ncbi:glycosyl transferase family 90-domain-containing protein [Mycena rebaudengoi]|nr:glycosyl transferase family 90-domain-containing protein [Mycena rebaudengoi]